MVQAFYKGWRVTEVNQFDQRTVEVAVAGSLYPTRIWVEPENITVVDLPEERMVFDD